MNNFQQHGYPADPRFRESDGWSVFISYIGFFKSSGDFHWEQASPMYSVHFVLKGRGIFQRNGRKYEVKAGDAYTFFPGDHIVYYDFPESPWEYIWFRLDGKNVERALDATGITRSKPHRAIERPAMLESHLHEIGSLYGKRKHPPLFPMAAACSCLDLISGSGTGSREGQLGGKSIADSFISIIESQLDSSPSIKEIASLMKIDRTTLFRSFIKEHGISPKRFLENRRISKSAELLSKTKLSVKEISEACGFSHPSHFGKVFQEHYGQSPAKWRVK
ncbi:MAG TPA: hypothetical protein DET40_08295 [Lentisphaeria bacterium]|nr:MAG: hypothetical protein A2X45_10510 [Lentisphaerae bacterium GWF2_50_93]HCE43533.1 hypothetical protein [Lentisphaeria bacterium]